MNESAARTTLLLRAFETTAAEPNWTDETRGWANREAIAAFSGKKPSADVFIARRAEMGVRLLQQRDAKLSRLDRAFQWPNWLAPLILVSSFLLGILSDVFGANQRINLLAPPLIFILMWNLAIYLAMLGTSLTTIFRRSASNLGVFGSALERLAFGLARRIKGSPSYAPFVESWLKASRPLTRARVGHILHWSAAAVATGALSAMYVRGLSLEYLAGWESTFLDAAIVKNLLTVILGPASALSGIVLPDLDGVKAIHFAQSKGENAAAWIHLYSITLGLFVVLPRVLLGAIQLGRASRLSRIFPLPLKHDPYFKALSRLSHGESIKLAIWPYSYALSSKASHGLAEALNRCYGAQAVLNVHDRVAFGDEDTRTENLSETNTGLIVALFALTATPEAENHGYFIARLNALRENNTPLLVIVDQSGFLKRFADMPERLAQRQAAWINIVGETGHIPVFADLENGQLGHLEKLLSAAIAASAPPPALSTNGGKHDQ